MIREGNYEPIRLVAFDCLLLCKPPGRSGPLAQYLVDVVQNDYSLNVRRHVACGLSESILMTLALGEVPNAPVPPAIFDDGSGDAERADKQREAGQMALVKAVRKEFGKKLDLRQLVQDELLQVLSAARSGADQTQGKLYRARSRDPLCVSQTSGSCSC
jgi:transcription initiation factor TFIID subunit 2